MTKKMNSFTKQWIAINPCVPKNEAEVLASTEANTLEEALAYFKELLGFVYDIAEDSFMGNDGPIRVKENVE